MTETRLRDSRSESRKSQPDSSVESRKKTYKRPAPREATGSLLSIAEVKRRFGIDEYRLYLWAEEGRLHVVREGGRFKYPDWEVRAILMELYDLGVAA